MHSYFLQIFLFFSIFPFSSRYVCSFIYSSGRVVCWVSLGVLCFVLQFSVSCCVLSFFRW